MSSVLGELAPHATLTYVDDTIVYGKNFDEEIKNLRAVFQQFLEAKISQNFGKCEFFKNKLNI
jgi:hypothetical protein